MLCGMQEIDVEDWEKHTIYKSYTRYDIMYLYIHVYMQIHMYL